MAEKFEFRSVFNEKSLKQTGKQIKKSILTFEKRHLSLMF